VVAQDNKSSILLETNGMASSTKRTQHITVRYFFVTDRIKKGNMIVKYCPTADMISGVLTKPLQGSTFHKLRPLLLNLKDDPTTTAVVLAHRSVLEPIVTGKRGWSKTWHNDATVRTSGSRQHNSNAVSGRNKQRSAELCLNLV
jgi:hypothetical protein